jgi:hypothetical protein
MPPNSKIIDVTKLPNSRTSTTVVTTVKVTTTVVTSYDLLPLPPPPRGYYALCILRYIQCTIH